MGNDETLRKMHKLHLKLADELKRICEKNGIKYFMLAGTMLGAVRHGGFIPWDDDMDFGMLRNDFERFLDACENDLNKEVFYLQTDRNEKYYTFNFAKLRLNGTRVMESFSCETKTHQGIYIDIFPLDVVPDNKMKKVFQYRLFYVVRNLLWVKSGYGTKERKQELGYKVAKCISSFTPITFLKMIKHNCISRYSDMCEKYVVTSDGTYGLKKETLHREWIEKIDDFNFEDRKYPGIANYNDYLKYLYGDYMKLPPEDLRNHHGRLDVDFGFYRNQL